MKRTDVNPWEWSLHLGYNQAECIEGTARRLYCSGQTSVDGQGMPCHDGDMRGQLGLALGNLSQVLAAGGMGPKDVVRLVIYATDVDLLLRNFDLLTAMFSTRGRMPATSLVGVTRLALPALMVEIEATAEA